MSAQNQRQEQMHKAGSIELHIEALLLHGFSSHQRFRIAQAVERELTRLLAEGGLPAAWSQGKGLVSLDGGQFEAQPGAKAESIGAQVAQAVYGGSTK
ncbi:MAG: hypothetical protein PVG14_05810 [Anaerolineales bacterium]|jgi:hypothetical protein